MRPATIPLAEQQSRRRDRIFARAQGQFDVRDAGGVTQIMISGEIGHDGVTEAAFRHQLSEARGDLVLQINSPGGDMFEGIAIYNLALSHPHNVRVEVIGVAASAASIIAMAGDQIAVAPNSHLMIHRCWGLTIGNTADHAEQATLLAKFDRSLALTYSARSGQSEDSILRMMTAESWFDADEAIKLGLATEKIGQSAPAAKFDLSVYANLPKVLRGRPSQETLNARDPGELKRILVRAGMTHGAAEKVTAGGWPALQKNDSDREATSNLIAIVTAAADIMHKIGNAK